MKKFLIALAVVVFCVACPSALAQSALSNASISGNFTGFFGGAGTQPAVLASASYQVTQRVTGGYWALAVPALSRSYNMGVGTYTLPLSSLIGKTLSSKLLFDASAIPIGFSAGAGEVSTLGVRHGAGIAGASFGIPVSESTTLNLFEFYGVFGGGQTSGLFGNISGSTFTMATGVTVQLDHLGPSFRHRFTNKKKAAVRLNRCTECQ
jgi:hypothetical protein